MPATLRVIDTDGSTIITAINFGNVDTPGETSDKLIYVENFGDETAQDVSFTLEAVGTNDGDDWALIAADSGGSPGSYDTTAIDLGDILSLNRVAVWAKVALPSGLTSDNNPRRFNLKASGVTI